MYMEFIKHFSTKHYEYYLNEANSHIHKYTETSKWANSLDKEELLIWVRLILLFEANDDNYYEEMCVMLTLIIRLFILELDIDYTEIKLSNDQIKKIYLKFKKIMFAEYYNKYDLGDKKLRVTDSLL